MLNLKGAGAFALAAQLLFHIERISRFYKISKILPKTLSREISHVTLRSCNEKHSSTAGRLPKSRLRPVLSNKQFQITKTRPSSEFLLAPFLLLVGRVNKKRA